MLQIVQCCMRLYKKYMYGLRANPVATPLRYHLTRRQPSTPRQAAPRAFVSRQTVWGPSDAGCTNLPRRGPPGLRNVCKRGRCTGPSANTNWARESERRRYPKRPPCRGSSTSRSRRLSRRRHASPPAPPLHAAAAPRPGRDAEPRACDLTRGGQPTARRSNKSRQRPTPHMRAVEPTRAPRDAE